MTKVAGVALALGLWLGGETLAAGWEAQQAGAPISWFARDRGISSARDFWLNGVGGLFFRFSAFGYLNLLALPLAIRFVVHWRRREKWERALFAIGLFLGALVAVKGYFNLRYALTLAPAVTCWTLRELWGLSDRRAVRRAVMSGAWALMAWGYMAHRYTFGNEIERGVLTSPASPGQEAVVEFFKSAAPTGAILAVGQPWAFSYLPGPWVDGDERAVKTVLHGGRPTDFETLVLTRHIDFVLTDDYQEAALTDRNGAPFLAWVYDRFDVALDSPPYYANERLHVLQRRPDDRPEASLLAVAGWPAWVNEAAPPPSEVRRESASLWSLNSGGEAPLLTPEADTPPAASALLRIEGANWDLARRLPEAAAWRGRTVTCFVELLTPCARQFRVTIYDGMGVSQSRYHPGDDRWRVLRVSHTVHARADRLDCRISCERHAGAPPWPTVQIRRILVDEGRHYTLRAWQVWKQAPGAAGVPRGE